MSECESSYSKFSVIMEGLSSMHAMLMCVV